MTTGALVFAFNNEQTDYVAMASWCARNIRRHLNIPVAVVTDLDPGDPKVAGFDHVIASIPSTGGSRWFEDYAATVSWHNAGRVDAYSLTPWEQTLVIDADYVVASDRLKTVLAHKSDFMCHRSAYNLATGQPLSGLNVFGKYNMPMWWATVMMFRKSTAAEYIFDCMQMIRQNWEHYRVLYSIENRTYRNDFALSIALGIVNGHTGQVDEIPWPLLSVMPDTALRQTALDQYAITYTDVLDKNREVGCWNQDFHAMGKKHLEMIIASQ